MTDHVSDFDEDEDGWHVVRCSCGVESPGLPDMETAADVWGDHMYAVGYATGQGVQSDG